MKVNPLGHDYLMGYVTLIWDDGYEVDVYIGNYFMISNVTRYGEGYTHFRVSGNEPFLKNKIFGIHRLKLFRALVQGLKEP